MCWAAVHALTECMQSATVRTHSLHWSAWWWALCCFISPKAAQCVRRIILYAHNLDGSHAGHHAADVCAVRHCASVVQCARGHLTGPDNAQRSPHACRGQSDSGRICSPVACPGLRLGAAAEMYDVQTKLPHNDIILFTYKLPVAEVSHGLICSPPGKRDPNISGYSLQKH